MQTRWRAITKIIAILIFTLTITPMEVCYAHIAKGDTSKDKFKVPVVSTRNKLIKNIPPTDIVTSYPNPYLKRLNTIRKAILYLNPSINTKRITHISLAVHKYAKNYSLDPLLVVSIMAVETGRTFIPNLNRGFGWGLMQIVPKYHKARLKRLNVKIKDLYNIFSNVKVGCDIFSEYLKRSRNNLRVALIYYNGSHLKITYAEKVLDYHDELKKVLRHKPQ